MKKIKLTFWIKRSYWLWNFFHYPIKLDEQFSSSSLTTFYCHWYGVFCQIMEIIQAKEKCHWNLPTHYFKNNFIWDGIFKRVLQENEPTSDSITN